MASGQPSPRKYGRPKSFSFVSRRQSALRLYSSSTSQEYDEPKRIAYVENISGDFEKQSHAWDKFLKAYPYIEAVLKRKSTGGQEEEDTAPVAGWTVKEAKDALCYALMKWKYVYEVKTSNAAQKKYADNIDARTGRFQSLYRLLRGGNRAAAGSSKDTPKRQLPKPIVKQLSKLIRQGIPPKYRGKIWQLCAGSDQKREEGLDCGQTYERLNRIIQQNEDLFPNQSWIDIDKDVRRTVLLLQNGEQYPDDLRPCLQRVLVTYALRNPELGYCQGMSTVVALLLLHMDEESAFWVLSAMIEDMMPRFYATDMGGVKTEAATFEFLVQTYLPKVYSRISPLGVPVKPFAIKWFLCLYLNSLSVSIAVRVWDCFFHEGVKVLHRIGLAALHLKEPEIVNSDAQFGSIYESVDKATIECTDAEALFRAAYGTMFMGRNFSSKMLLKVRRHVLKHDRDFFSGRSSKEVDRDALEKLSCQSPSSLRYRSRMTSKCSVGSLADEIIEEEEEEDEGNTRVEEGNGKDGAGDEGVAP
jgi:hypothetical protein